MASSQYKDTDVIKDTQNKDIKFMSITSILYENSDNYNLTVLKRDDSTNRASNTAPLNKVE